ncbi:MAG: hypothetical protein AB7P21_07200 [Lautropia sp.]
MGTSPTPDATTGWREDTERSVRYRAPRSIRIEGSGAILELVVDPALVHGQQLASEHGDLLGLQWRLRGSGVLTQVAVVVEEADLVTFAAAIDRLVAGRAAEAVLEGRETPSSVLQLQAASEGIAATLTMLACHPQLPGRFVLERLPLDDGALMSIRNWARG